MDLPIATGLIQPLSPDDFQPAGTIGTSNVPGDNVAATTPSDAGSLDTTDLVTLTMTLGLLRRARAAAGSGDARTATQARWDLVGIVSYLTGFADGKGWIEPVSANPGFAGLAGEGARPSADMLLDRLETALAQLVDAPTTRRPNTAKAIYGAIGDAVVGIGASVTAAGIVALFVPSP